MKLSWLMGCNAALYLTLHETGLERWGWWGARGTGVPGPGAPGPRSARQARTGKRWAWWGGRDCAERGTGTGGQASVAEQQGLRGWGRLECHTPRGAQAAINLKSLGILLAFSKYY